MPADQRATLHDIVDRAHAAGYRVRFWATPDTPGPARDALWTELLDAGVDHLNTDDLSGLEAFLRSVEESETATGAPYTMLQMNLCLSGVAGCYGRTAYPAVVDEAVATIREHDAEAVSLNEACTTTARSVTACSAHLSTRGSLEAQAANDAQCAELAAVLAEYDARAAVFGGDVNRRESCAPDGWWTLTDAAAAQAPGIQHVYGSDRLASPTGSVVPAVHTDHDFLRADARLAPGPR